MEKHSTFLGAAKAYIVVGVLVAYGGTPAKAALVNYWTMNQTSGSVVDSVGGVNMAPQSATSFTYGVSGVTAGTYGALTVTSGESAAFGTAISGDGSTTGGNKPVFAITTGSSLDSLSSTTGFTVMAWVDPTALTGNPRVLSSVTTEWGYAIAHFVTGAGAHQTTDQLFTTFGKMDYTTTDSTETALNAWQHVAVTYEATGTGVGTATFFLNGNQVGSVTSAAGKDFTVNLSDPFALFGQPDGTNPLTGALTQVKVYNDVETLTQIRADAVAVPEPATFGLLTASIGCLLLRRRRSR